MAPALEALIERSSYRRPVDLKKLRFIYSAIESGQSVLEMGCGDGAIIGPLAEAGHPAVACDLEPVDIPGVEFLRADALSLNLERTFDVVIMSEVIEHVTEPEALLAVARDHLVPGGLLLLTTPNGYGPYELHHYQLNPSARLRRWNWLRARFGREPYAKGGGPDHAQFFTFSRLRGLIEQAGFAIEEAQNSDALLGGLNVSERLAEADVRFADRVPHWLASGWYVRARKR